MEKTEMMKEFQAKTGIKAMVMVKNGTLVLPSLTVRASQQFFPSEEYIDWLETKAAAYDRLMSGGRKTPKEVANFLGKPIAMDRVGVWCEHKSKPSIGEGCYEGMWVSGLTGNDYVRSISMQIDFNGNWEDSLTLPDGWEEACSKI